jgi:fumarate reductase flavoprotein subunit
MSEKRSSLTRRRFITAGSAAIAAPLVMNMAGKVAEANGAEKEGKGTAEKNYNFVDKKSCDLVVLGGGGSGLVAAIRAAQLSGKKVIVLEKDSIAGGGASGARTMRTFRSKWQAKRNIKDTTVEYANRMMDFLFWRVDPELITNCILGTGQFFDWACELGGNIEDNFSEGIYKLSEPDNLDIEPIGPQLENQPMGKNFGGFMTDLMKEKAKDFGVEILTSHPVVDVEVKDGKIVAAIAKSDKGYVRVACKACVLATGSWISNKEILQKYAPEYAEAKQYMKLPGMPSGASGGQSGPPSGQGGGQGQSAGAPGGQGGGEGGQGGPPGSQGGASTGMSRNVGHESPNYTGDGIPLAEKVGAFLDYDSFCLRMMGGGVSGGNSKVVSAMGLSPFAISVNLNGKRYCSEPVMHMGMFAGAHITLDQPHAQTFTLFDQNALAATLEFQKCVKTGGRCTPVKIGAMMGDQSTLPETMEEIQSDLKKSSAIKADTLEELADKMGVDKAKFLETVKAYNEACATGSDMQVYKNKEYLVPINKGPFYAGQGGVGHDGAFGGVRVNAEMQAFKADRKTLVEGLYVTGDFATGRHISLKGLKRQVINDLSWAFSSGFIAGTNAAKYLKSA